MPESTPSPFIELSDNWLPITRENIPKQIRNFILVILFLSLAISAGGCGNEESPSMVDIFKGVLAACGENTIYLNMWYGVREDEPDVDPIGGYLYLYWIDENDQICHGVPGISGQPGPEVILAWTDESYEAIKDGSIITEDQLTDMQRIPFDGGSYDGMGLHFAQYANWKWRITETGYGFSDPGSFFHSIPEVVDIQGEFCLMPIMASYYPDCLAGSGMQLSDPSSLGLGSDSESGVCQVRVQPVQIKMPISERVNFCLTK